MRAHDLDRMLASDPDFTEGETREAEFWCPERFNDGMLWQGRFTGRSPWEMHPTTDELLHVLEGEVEVTVHGEAGAETLTLRAGSVMVVPKGRWHRLLARGRVRMCGVTPGPTEHSDGDDPPEP